MNPNRTPVDVNTLTQLFQQTKTCVETLNECLQKEFNSLKENNSEAILLRSQEKEQLVSQLHQLEMQRKSLTPTEQVHDKVSYLAWLDSVDQSESLKQQWKKIGEQIQICQKQNNTNAIIGERLAESTSGLINILTGRSTVEQSTYNATGKKASSIQGLHNTTA